ncbi:hypothetical protein BH09PSE3_BH09PSE3_26750 [soil metagenome]
MRPLVYSDRRTARLYEALFACDSVEHISRDFLVPLSSFFGASSVALLCYSRNPEGLSFGWGALHAIGQESLGAYREKYFELDPIFRLANAISCQTKMPVCQAARYSDITDRFGLPSEFKRFLESIGIDDIITGIFPVTHISSEIVNLSFHRSPGVAPFGYEDLHQLKAIRAAISCVISGILARDSMRICESSISLMTHQGSAFGVVLLSDNGEIGYSTPLGEIDLARVLQTHFDGDWKQLAASLAHRITSSEARTCEITLGETFVAARRVEPLDGVGRTLVIFRKSGNDAFVSRCRQYQLSEREIEISQLMNAGMPDKLIGFHLKISTRTVQNHVRSVYRKTGVHSRSQLLAKMTMNS